MVKPKGIVAGYPYMPLPQKIRAYIQLLRPFTILAPILAVAFGTAACLKFYGITDITASHLIKILFGVLAMGFCQAAGQVLNQTKDIEADIINKKNYRPIPSGLITIDEAMRFGLALGLLTLILAFIVNIPFGLMMSLLLFLAIFYTLNPVRAKHHMWTSIVWLGVSRGFLPLPVIWTIFGSWSDPLPWAFGIVMGIWVSGFQLTKDLADIKGDKEFNIPTLPVVHGVEKTLAFMMATMFVSLAVFIAFMMFDVFPGSFMWYTFLYAPMCFIVVGIEDRTTINIDVAENTAEWIIFYLTIAAFYMLLPILI